MSCNACGSARPKHRLIVNADDFGFNRDVNDGIVDAHRKGILTATTLMANGEAFDHAVQVAKAVPTLDVGVHLVMVQGESLARPGKAMPATVKDLIIALATKQIDPFEEMVYQVQRITAAGIRPTHLDTHKHTHLMPSVLKAMVRIAHEFRIPWIRRPFDFEIRQDVPVMKSAMAMGMRVTAAAMARAITPPLMLTDHFAGFQITGRLDKARLISTLEALPEGLTELMCHPARMGDELKASKTRLKESRAVELEALTSPEVRQVLLRKQIALANYR